MRLRVATRRSALALAQTRATIRLLQTQVPSLEVDEVHIETEGDRIQDRPLAEVGGKGLFIKELERALVEHRADLAIHSMKDLPAEIAEGTTLACVPKRASPWDVLLTRDGESLSGLAQGARVGTSSLRRALQLRARRADLVIESLRGNVDTRLRRLREGTFDAIVLAQAGLQRLGVEVQGYLLRDELVPAVGQGLLALQTRADDTHTIDVVRTLEDHEARRAGEAERWVMRELGGSCVVPLGAYADITPNGMEMAGFYASTDGARWRCERALFAMDCSSEDAGRSIALALREGLRDSSGAV